MLLLGLFVKKQVSSNMCTQYCMIRLGIAYIHSKFHLLQNAEYRFVLTLPLDYFFFERHLWSKTSNFTHTWPFTNGLTMKATLEFRMLSQKQFLNLGIKHCQWWGWQLLHTGVAQRPGLFIWRQQLKTRRFSSTTRTREYVHTHAHRTFSLCESQHFIFLCYSVYIILCCPCTTLRTWLWDTHWKRLALIMIMIIIIIEKNTMYKKKRKP